MNILITGGAGYLGSVTARILLNKGHQVRVLDSLIHGGDSLTGLYPFDNFQFTYGDIRSISALEEALVSVDAVIHLAALVGDPACARDPELSRSINFDATMKLFELCRRFGVSRFILASTCSNYGRQTDPDKYVSEDADLTPISVYAETKVASERSLLDMSGGVNPEVSVLRFATLFGISPRMRFDLTVNEFTRDLLTNKKLSIYGEQHWRPYVHVVDAGRAISEILETSPELISGQVFNVGDSNQNYQKGKIVEMICEQLEYGVTIENVYKEEDPRDYRVSFSKIHETINYQITRDVNFGIYEIINAVSQNVFTDLDHSRYRN